MFNVKRTLGFIWAAPLTLAGLVYVAVFAAAGWYKSLGWHGDAAVWQFVPDKSPSWLASMWQRWAGQTIGNVVVIKHNVDTDRGRIVLRHEQEHVRQYMTLGIFMPIIYALAWLGLKLSRYSHPYYDNPFEIDARRSAGQVIDVIGAIARAQASGQLKTLVKKS